MKSISSVQHKKYTYKLLIRALYIITSFIVIPYSTAEVIDSANLFSNSSKKRADKNIAYLNKMLRKNLVIESIPTLNGSKAADIALHKAQSRKVNGIYILIAKQEKKFQIKVGNNTRKLFGPNEVNNLKERLRYNFKNGDFDSGLSDTVNYFSSILNSAIKINKKKGVLQQNVKNYSDNNKGSSIMKWIFMACMIFVLIRLISSLFNRSNNSRYGDQQQNPQTTGGMGFFSTFLTGMFGAAAGNWLYDTFAGHRSSQDPPYYSDNSLYANEPSQDSFMDQGNDWQEIDDFDNYSDDEGDYGDSDFDLGGLDDGGGDW